MMGDKATIKSISFPPTSASGRCISFWYHMYGSSIGTLNAYFRKLKNGNTIGNELMWQLKGNQGDNWQQGRIPISVTSYYQVSHCVFVQNYFFVCS